MPTLKLTDAALAKIALPPGKKDLIVWDTELKGFGFRLGQTSASYFVAYRPAGAGRSANMQKFKLGPASAFKSAAEARAAARAALGKVAAGGDPAAERAEAKRREKSRLADALDAYEKDLKRRQYVNHKTVMSGLRTKMGDLLDLDIADIKARQYIEIIEELERGGRAGAAQDFRSRCRAFLAYAANRAKLIDSNPLAGYRQERSTRADKVAKATHGRSLSDAELARVWNASDPATVFGRLIRFLILTGCRRGEAAGLAYLMVDRDAGVINLPASFTKQGRGHVVPITPALATVLDGCTVDARSDLVFASPRSGGPFKGWTQLVRRLNAEAEVDFDLHDLRRTFRTGLSKLGIDTELAELALGHAREDLEARYNRDDGRKQLTAAFASWATQLNTVLRDQHIDKAMRSKAS